MPLKYDRTLQFDGTEYARVLKIAAGCVRGTINDHGPVTYDTVSSAAKRITSTLYAALGVPLPAPADRPASGEEGVR